jgi:hypothetical protein
MSKVSRRSLVASAASLPALAALPGKVEIGLDAELLALGQELQSLRADFLAEQAQDAAEKALVEAETEAVTGITSGAAPKDHTDPYWQALSTVGERVFTDPNLVGWDELMDELWARVHAIQALPAHTATGLGVHALAVSMAMAEYWDPRAMELGGNETTRLFIETVCRFASVVPYAVDAYPDEHEDRWLAENAAA